MCGAASQGDKYLILFITSCQSGPGEITNNFINSEGCLAGPRWSLASSLAWSLGQSVSDCNAIYIIFNLDALMASRKFSWSAH